MVLDTQKLLSEAVKNCPNSVPKIMEKFAKNYKKKEVSFWNNEDGTMSLGITNEIGQQCYLTYWVLENHFSFVRYSIPSYTKYEKAVPTSFFTEFMDMAK